MHRHTGRGLSDSQLLEFSPYHFSISGKVILAAFCSWVAGVGVDPDMRMRHFFTDNLRMHCFDVECLLERLSDLAGYLKVFAAVRYVTYPAMMRFRYHEAVPGRERTDIEEGEEVVILIDFVRGNLSRNDFAKDTGFHEAIVGPAP